MSETENTTIRSPMQTTPLKPVTPPKPVIPPKITITKTDQKQNSVLASAMGQIAKLTQKFMLFEKEKIAERVSALELRLQSLEEKIIPQDIVENDAPLPEEEEEENEETL